MAPDSPHPEVYRRLQDEVLADRDERLAVARRLELQFDRFRRSAKRRHG